MVSDTATAGKVAAGDARAAAGGTSKTTSAKSAEATPNTPGPNTRPKKISNLKVKASLDVLTLNTSSKSTSAEPPKSDKSDTNTNVNPNRFKFPHSTKMSQVTLKDFEVDEEGGLWDLLSRTDSHSFIVWVIENELIPLLMATKEEEFR
jgi:hypothetical protein